MSNFDTDYTIEPTCPYCGYEEPDTCEMDHSENESSHCCGKCGKEYMYNAIIQISWSSSKADCLNDLADHDWKEWSKLWENTYYRKCRVCRKEERKEGEL